MSRRATQLEGKTHMAITVEAFGKQCHDIVAADPGPEGRKKICALVQTVLRDADFIKQHVRADGPERQILYQDPEFGFCILAHSYHGPKESPPHDHGPTWAIYGQATGETIMTDWALIDAPTDDKPGTVRHVRDYSLTPGMAYVYEPGELHSPRRDASTTLIRMEGLDVSKIRRAPFIAVAMA